MKVLKAYKFRLYPTEEQALFFIKNFGCARFTYNHLLKARQQEYQEIGKVSNQLTPAMLKKDYPFLKEADSLALANAQLNLNRAFKNFFSGRGGFPNLKTKKAGWQSYTTNNQQGTIMVKNQKYLKLPKLKSLVAIDGHRPVCGKIKSATISAWKNDQFFVALLCEEVIKEFPKTQKVVGLTFSSEQCLETSKNLTTTWEATPAVIEQMKQQQRRLKCRATSARRRKVKLADAKNYQKQKARVVELHQHYKNQKRDYIEKLSHELISKYDYLFIEAHPTISETGFFDYHDWQLFLKKIKYKAKWYGKTIYLVDISSVVANSTQNRPQLIEKTGEMHFL